MKAIDVFLATAGLLTSIDGFVIPHSQVLLGVQPAPRTTSLQASSDKFALLFDCDGVIIETEELHRLAYNAAFKEFNLHIGNEAVEWSVAYYDILQNTGKSCTFLPSDDCLHNMQSPQSLLSNTNSGGRQEQNGEL